MKTGIFIRHGFQQRTLSGSIRTNNSGERAWLQRDTDVTQNDLLPNAKGQVCCFVHYNSFFRFALINSPMKKGAPIKEVTTPIGNSAGLTTVRAIRSAMTSNNAPQRIEAGSTRRLSGKNETRMRWGTTRPTKP